MRPISIKLEEETIEAIDGEAEDRDLTRSQYLRRIIDDRHEHESNREERLRRIEALLDELVTGSAQSTTEPPDTDEKPTPELEPEPESVTEAESENEKIDTTDEIAAAVEAAAENWDDSPDRIEARKQAARSVLTALREQAMSKSEILDEVEPRHSIDGQSPRTWWRANLAECNPSPLKELAEYSNSTKKWQFTGQ